MNNKNLKNLRLLHLMKDSKQKSPIKHWICLIKTVSQSLKLYLREIKAYLINSNKLIYNWSRFLILISTMMILHKYLKIAILPWWMKKSPLNLMVLNHSLSYASNLVKMKICIWKMIKVFQNHKCRVGIDLMKKLIHLGSISTCNEQVSKIDIKFSRPYK